MKTNQAICLAPVKWAKHQWLPGDIWIPGLYSGKAPSGPCWAEVQLPLDGYLMLKKREPKGEGFQCTYKLENSVRYFKMDFGTGENEYMQEITPPKPANGEGMENYTTSSCYSYVRWAPKCPSEYPKAEPIDYLRRGLEIDILHKGL